MRPHVRSRLLTSSLAAGALALSGCGVPGVPTTAVHSHTGPTPTVTHARTAVSTADAAPPWKGLPLRTRKKSGRPGDPINVAFEGSKSAILAAFKQIGWVEADPLTTKNDLHLAAATVAGQPYRHAPVSTLYLFGRAQDVAVERELGSTAKRDHARLWDAHRTDPVTHLELWLGDAARDNKIEVVRKDGVIAGTTHHIDADIDAVRDRIEDNLPRVRAPVLVVRGEYDPLVPRRWAEEAARLLPNARCAEIAGVAHVAHYDAPARFVRLARPFLDASGDGGDGGDGRDGPVAASSREV